MNLAVVTHTCKSFNRNIDKCVSSVGAALPDNARHYIIDTPNDERSFIIARYEAMNLADIVIFVDDDDYIPITSLQLCMATMLSYNAGVAYTQETIVNSAGKEELSLHENVKYEDIVNNACTIHHMTAYRSSAVTSRSLDLSLKYKFGIEWSMRVDAICNAGAVYIPVNGYYWVHHAAQYHRTIAQRLHTSARYDEFKGEMKLWNTRSGAIPCADLT